MKTLRLMAAAVIVLCLVGLPRTHAAQKSKEQLQTGVLGGAACPSAEELAAMQKGQYIFHACNGKLTKVQVQKSRLPHDPEGHVQIVWTAQSPLDKNTVYVNQGSITCKSTDGGKTWTSYKRDWPGSGTGSFQILDDGRFIIVTAKENGDRAVTWSSSDEGRTWRRISQFKMPTQPKRYVCLWTFGLFRLPNGTLICGVLASDAKPGEHGKGIGGSKSRLLAFRSTDDGQSWHGPSTIADYTGEGGIVLTASGKLLAALRYQRLKSPEDPDGIGELMRGGSSTTSERMPFKHVFLADSDDEGKLIGDLMVRLAYPNTTARA